MTMTRLWVRNGCWGNVIVGLEKGTDGFIHGVLYHCGKYLRLLFKDFCIM